jgi:hypothetical protein
MFCGSIDFVVRRPHPLRDRGAGPSPPLGVYFMAFSTRLRTREEGEWVSGQRGRIGRREAEVDLACGGLRQRLRKYSLGDLINIARLSRFLGRDFT